MQIREVITTINEMQVAGVIDDGSMPPDSQSILASKQAYRRQLAARPIGEKLRMLDALRKRELAIRGHASRGNVAGGRSGAVDPSPK